MDHPKDHQDPSSRTGCSDSRPFDQIICDHPCNPGEESISEEYNRTILTCIALLHAQEQEEAFSTLLQEGEDGPEPLLRPQLDQQISRMIGEDTRRRKSRAFWRQARRWGNWAAVLLCVFGLGFATLFSTVDAVKVGVLGFAVRAYQESTRFDVQQFLGEGQQGILENAPDLSGESYPRPHKIPSNLLEDHRYRNDFYAREEFLSQNGQDWAIYTCYSLTSTIYLDTENCLREEVAVNGWEGYRYTKYKGSQKGRECIIWHDERYIYLVMGNVSYHRLLQMAQSVAPAASNMVPQPVL